VDVDPAQVKTMGWNVGQREGRLLLWFLTLFFGESFSKALQQAIRPQGFDLAPSSALPLFTQNCSRQKWVMA
jgi:hypothetical protein